MSVLYFGGLNEMVTYTSEIEKMKVICLKNNLTPLHTTIPCIDSGHKSIIKN